MRGILEVDLAKLRNNIQKIRKILPEDCQFFSVLKSNAYGLGLEQIARCEAPLVDGFCLANTDEAIVVRKFYRDGLILILSPVLPDEVPALFDFDLTPLISSREEADLLNRMAHQRNLKKSIHVKIDTGMGRAGVLYDQAHEFVQYIQNNCHSLQITGFGTHYSSVTTDAEFTNLQHKRFVDAVKNYFGESLIFHAASSFAIEQYIEGTNAVRIGALQYGIPEDESLIQKLQLESVATLKCFVAGKKLMPKGSKIGYCQTYTLPKDTMIGLLSLGYADGVSINLSNCGYVMIRGQKCPIIGRISMDQMMIDISDRTVNLYDTAVVFGQGGPELNEFSVLAQVPIRGCLCGVSSRVIRRYIDSRYISAPTNDDIRRMVEVLVRD